MGFKSALGGFRSALGGWVGGCRLAWLFQVLGCGLPVAMGAWGRGLCSPWILGLMGFARRYILCLPLSRLDGYGSWGRGPAMPVRIETSRYTCVFFFFFFAMELIFGWILIVVVVVEAASF